VTDVLVTARVVAERLEVSVETVLRWAAVGKLPSVRLSSRAIRFRQSAIDEWIAERERGAAPRGGDTQPGGRAHLRAYAPLLSSVTPNPPRDRGDNRGGS
jgi:excisionase family DNA binding protein